MFLFARVLLPLVKISALLDNILANKGPKNPRTGELVRKTLKTFNLTTTNAILMKLTSIMYLHKNVNRKPLRARNSVFW